MKTNKYGTPRQRIMKATLALLFIIIVALVNGAGKKFYLSQYQEECYEHEWYDEEYCLGYWSWIDYEKINGSWQEINLTEPICRCGDIYFAGGCLRTRSLPNVSKCLKYHLVRIAD